VALSAPLFAAEIQINGANALDGDLAMVGNGEDVCFERGIGLEGSAVDGDVDVGGGAEDPVVAGMAVTARFGGSGGLWEVPSTVPMVTFALTVGVEEPGDVGGWLDGWGWEVAPGVAEREGHFDDCLDVIGKARSSARNIWLSSGQQFAKEAVLELMEREP